MDKSLRSYGLRPTRADRCCYVLYNESTQQKTKQIHWASDEQSSLAALADMNRPVPAVWEANSCGRTDIRQTLRPVAHEFAGLNMDLESALDYLLDPISGSHARNKTVDGVITIYVDDCFFSGKNLS